MYLYSFFHFDTDPPRGPVSLNGTCYGKKKHAQNGLLVIVQNLLVSIGKAVFCKSLAFI